MMNRVVILIVISFFSCKQQKTTSIYFFEQQSMSTIIALDSVSIFKQEGLRKIEINNEELLDLINRLIKNEFDNNSNYYPDVRYKIDIANQSVYLGYEGNYITSKGKRGKINFIDFIEKYVRENQKYSILITDPIPVFEEYLEEEN